MKLKLKKKLRRLRVKTVNKRARVAKVSEMLFIQASFLQFKKRMLDLFEDLINNY